MWRGVRGVDERRMALELWVIGFVEYLKDTNLVCSLHLLDGLS